MDISKPFSVICVSRKSFCPQKLVTAYRKLIGFSRFFKFGSYNLFFRWIFYFIAPYLNASFTLFRNSVSFFLELIQLKLDLDLVDLTKFVVVSIAIRKLIRIFSKQLK